MKKSVAFAAFLITCVCAQAQVMSPQFNYLKKYMGINVFGGYAQQTFKHKSLGRFATSFNSVFASTLSTQLAIPQQYEGPIAGVELSAAMIRLGYARRFNQPLQFEAPYKNGSIRKNGNRNA
ncbi:MAG: hypothetical protein EOO03_02225 [Chitinophagaceae bacterium]|nr:MAG: hypothetical protein EOO03_02225 [Chitinophagaceae bacterium]